MEALAAVSLVSNIVQFVDFSCKLFDQARSIHHSHSGASKDSDSLEVVTRDLHNITISLSQHRHLRAPQQSYRFYQSLTALQQLAKECHTAATELLSALQALKQKDSHSKWASFRTALASTWKKPRIQEMERRLDSYRSQIILHLQKLQDEKISAILSLLDSLLHRSRQSNSDLQSHISTLKTDVQSAITTMGEDLAMQAEPSRSSDFSRIMVSGEELAKKWAVSLTVLGCLRFNGMDSRHSQIPQAHAKTLEAVFEAQIVKWLWSSENLFWISGKPGSGKSTLMKYVMDNPRTLEELRGSMNGQQPILASFYFWVNGTTLQRSQEGLLRSMLYEILRRRTDLIEIAFPDAWNDAATVSMSNMPLQREWSAVELTTAFRRLVKSGATNTRLCLFIGGLDEYEGDHDELVDTVRNLKAMNIKLCVASRPWNVFEEAFGQDRAFKIYLEELNRPDIKLYVNEKLRDRPAFQELHGRISEAESIVRDIVQRSQGVFLWVFLVVRSLVEGMRNQDQLSQLQKRLNEMPSDLEEYYGYMFASIEPIYRQKTAHMLEFALHSEHTRSPLSYWFLDELDDNPNMALSMPIKAVTQEEFDLRCVQIRKRINGRCKSLLEISEVTNYVEIEGPILGVDFLHRTARDFLMTTQIRRVLRIWKAPDFDIELLTCKVLLAELKTTWQSYGDLRLPSDVFGSILSAAKGLQMRGEDFATPYLDQTASVCNSFVSKFDSRWLKHWTGPDILKSAIWDYSLYTFIRDSHIHWEFVSHPSKAGSFEAALSGTLSPEAPPADYIDRGFDRQCAILGCGPPMSLTTVHQHSMGDSLESDNSDEVFEYMKVVLNNTLFETSWRGQFDAKLHYGLKGRLKGSELADLYNRNKESHRKYREHMKQVFGRKVGGRKSVMFRGLFQ